MIIIIFCYREEGIYCASSVPKITSGSGSRDCVFDSLRLLFQFTKSPDQAALPKTAPS